jgi:TPR repeat protein
VFNEQTKEFTNYNYYHNGKVVSRDKEKAAEWYTKAAKHSHGGAQKFLDELKRAGKIK